MNIYIHEIPVEKDIVEIISKSNPQLKSEIIIENIKKNEHNDLTTLYYLLLKAYLEQGNASIADISSDFYIYKLKKKE